MDLITIIEKYVDLNIKRDDLKGIVDSCEKNIVYSTAGGDDAFSEGDYSLEKSYNDSVGYSNRRMVNALSELARVEVLLKEINALYLQMVSTCDISVINTATVECVFKHESLERKIAELQAKKQWATLMGDKAFDKRSFYEEQYYNEISNACFDKIEDLDLRVHYFKSFVADLNNRYSLKNQNTTLGK